MTKKKKYKLKYGRLPQSTRPNQVHKSAKDYDRNDAEWKKDTTDSKESD